MPMSSEIYKHSIVEAPHVITIEKDTELSDTEINKPTHGIIVHIANAQSHFLKAHAWLSHETKGQDFGRPLYPCPYFVYVSSNGSDETARCTVSSEPLLLTNTISAKISGTGAYVEMAIKKLNIVQSELI